MPDPVLSIWNALRRLVKELRTDSNVVEKKMGVTGAQLFVLRAIPEGSGLSINELAEKTLTHQSSVSVVVGKLERRGLLERRTGAADARRKEVFLTGKGRSLLAHAADTVQERLQTSLTKLGEPSLSELAHLLSQVLRDMGMSEEDAPMFFEEEQNPD